MRIDFDAATVEISDSTGQKQSYPFASKEAFREVSRAWLRVGWDTKHVYSFSWLGRPIIQLPEDMIRLQELVFAVKPNLIIETGIAHGGSLIYSASLCQLIGQGRVLGIDVEIRPHNREAIEAHPLSSAITMLEGDSTSPAIADQVASHVQPGDTTLVLLDSCHSKSHVLAELETYHRFVSVGSYIVVMDGIMRDLVGAPRSEPDWGENNPVAAVEEFLSGNSNFHLVEPALPFNEGMAVDRVTYWPNAYLQRVS